MFRNSSPIARPPEIHSSPNSSPAHTAKSYSTRFLLPSSQAHVFTEQENLSPLSFDSKRKVAESGFKALAFLFFQVKSSIQHPFVQIPSILQETLLLALPVPPSFLLNRWPPSPIRGLSCFSKSRFRLALEENIRLVKERDALALTVKKQSRDLTKLETFKRQLMLSLNDDSPSQSEGDFGASDVSVARISAWKDQSSFSRSSLDSDIGPSKTESAEVETKASSNKFSITPYITPQLSPNSTPRVSSTGGSPRRFSNADSLSKFSSGATSPTTSRFEDQGSMSSRYPSSQQISAASSPPRGHPLQGRTPQIDGKEFFRQARTRLSYEQFGTFLANIKELNAHRKSRQETLAKAEEIFGTENKDLYLSFQRLLNRNVQ